MICGLDNLLKALELSASSRCNKEFANRAYYAISALAHNLLVRIKHRYLPAEYHQHRTHTIFHHIFQIPAQVIKHAPYVLLRLEESQMLQRLKEHLLTLISRPGLYPLRS